MSLDLQHGQDTPWPATDVLGRLIEAVDHLLDVHNCDCHGYESLYAARNAAVAWRNAGLYAKLEAPEPESELEQTKRERTSGVPD